jgi:hypothetical protein
MKRLRKLIGISLATLLLGAFLIPNPMAADEFTAADLEGFEKHIRPLLIEHCVSCHGQEKQEGGLSLATRELMIQGGDSGSAVVPGKPDESLLIEAIEYLHEPKMPPSGKLKASQIELVRKWIESGVAWPSNSAIAIETHTEKHFQITEKHRQWWAFHPIRAVELPHLQKSDWARNEIDQFILAKLESAGASPVPQSDRKSWLRRVTLDLTGLPPTPEELDSFLNDSSDRAYDDVVERLLNSPSYGQRWARHWLDIVRYADYHDFNPAARVAVCEITEAWRYRDWVVESFNRDLPYDQFITHQIAGDLLPSPDGQEIYSDGLVATTFLSNGVWDRGDADKEKIISDMVDDNIGVIGKAFLALTLECARCHDHKFDPISTEDYYGLAGMFYSSHILKELGAKGGEYTVNRVPLLGPTALAKRGEQEKELSDVTSKLAAMDREHRLKELTGQGTTLVPTSFRSEQSALANIAEDGVISVHGPLMKDRYIIDFTVPQMDTIRFIRLEVLPDSSLPAGGPGRSDDGNFVLSRFKGAFTSKDPSSESTSIKFLSAQADFEQSGLSAQSTLDDDLKDGWAIAPEFGKPHAIVFEVSPETPISAGGKLSLVIEHQYADKHAIGKLRLSVLESLALTPTPDSDYRRELIANRDRLQALLAVPVPLAMATTEGGTAGGLFPGIQDVPIHIRGSYAKLGAVVPRRLPRFLAGEDQKPIAKGSGRAELASWIASRSNPLTSRVIVNRVWYLHFGEGLVRTPNNFGMLSEPPTHPELLDWLATDFVENGWSLKTLHRKIVLSATYRQSSRVAKDVFDKDPENRLFGRFVARRLEAEAIRDSILAVSGQIDLTPGGPAGDDFTIRRRSLFVQTARWQRDSYANLFDAANPDSSTEKRVTSTVAPQALLLLNHPWVHEQAQRLSERLLREAQISTDERIDRAYRLLFSRAPNEAEISIAKKVIESGDPSMANSGWIDLAHILLCSNEFIYID